MCKNKKYSKGTPFGVLAKNMKYVPHFVGHLIYVPHVPQMWDSCGTKVVVHNLHQNGAKSTHFAPKSIFQGNFRALKRSNLTKSV